MVKSKSTGHTSLEAMEKLLKFHPDPCATQAPYVSIAFFVAPLSDALPVEVTSCRNLFEVWLTKQNITKEFDQVSIAFKRQAEVNNKASASITRIEAADVKRDVAIAAINNTIGVLTGQASELAGSIAKLQVQVATENNSLSQDDQRLSALEGQMQSLLKNQKDSWAKALTILAEINSKVPPK